MGQKELENLFDNHYSLIEQKMTMFSDQMDSLRMKVEEICSNHLSHIKEEQMEIKTNVEWLMKSYWVVVSAAVGALITSLITLLEK